MLFRKLILLTVLIGFFIVSCDKEIIHESFTIRLNEKVQTNNDPLKFSISEINDSRCPSDVVCIWQGMAEVKLKVESPKKGEIILNTFDNQIGTFAGYSFELIEVSPYPISTKTIDLKDYLVTLNIQQIN